MVTVPFLETTNGGEDWHDISERLDNEDGFHLNAISAITDSGLFIVGEMGVMFRSSDWGLNLGKCGRSL